MYPILAEIRHNKISCATNSVGTIQDILWNDANSAKNIDQQFGRIIK